MISADAAARPPCDLGHDARRRPRHRIRGEPRGRRPRRRPRRRPTARSMPLRLHRGRRLRRRGSRRGRPPTPLGRGAASPGTATARRGAAAGRVRPSPDVSRLPRAATTSAASRGRRETSPPPGVPEGRREGRGAPRSLGCPRELIEESGAEIFCVGPWPVGGASPLVPTWRPTDSRSRIHTVHLSLNDHLQMRGLISQLLNFKTSCFNIALSPLGVQGLHAITQHSWR